MRGPAKPAANLGTGASDCGPPLGISLGHHLILRTIRDSRDLTTQPDRAAGQSSTLKFKRHKPGQQSRRIKLADYSF